MDHVHILCSACLGFFMMWVCVSQGCTTSGTVFQWQIEILLQMLRRKGGSEEVDFVDTCLKWQKKLSPVMCKCTRFFLFFVVVGGVSFVFFSFGRGWGMTGLESCS